MGGWGERRLAGSLRCGRVGVTTFSRPCGCVDLAVAAAIVRHGGGGWQARSACSLVGVTCTSHLGTLSLGYLADLAVRAAPARRLAGSHRLGLVGGPVVTSPLGTLILGGLGELAVPAAPACRLAGSYCLGLGSVPGASHLGTLSLGGLRDLADLAGQALLAAIAYRFAVAIPVFLVVRGVVAALLRAFLGEPTACCLFRFQAVVAALGHSANSGRQGIYAGDAVNGVEGTDAEVWGPHLGVRAVADKISDTGGISEVGFGGSSVA